MRTEITPGQTSDYLGFDLVMADNLPEPKVLLADRGYDADHIRKIMSERDIMTQIPMRKTARCASASTTRSTDCATWSNVVSINSRTPAEWRHVTTKPLRVFWASSTSPQSVFGSVICQHDLAITVLSKK